MSVGETGSGDGRAAVPFEGARGFNVIGFLSSATGHGAAARSTIELIASTGNAVACADLDLNDGRTRAGVEQPPCGYRYASSMSDLPYRVNLFHFNPSDAMAYVVRWRDRTGAHLFDRFNCVVPFWELPRVPDHWVPALAAMDAVLVPSRFVEDSIRAGFGDVEPPPIVRYPQSVTPPEVVRPDRARWLGGRAATTAVLLTFDTGSDFERKNPWGSIDAFQRAFPGDDSVTLLVKANNAMTKRAAAGMRRLEALAAADPRIVLVRGTLSRDDLWNLYASCDVYISLHRAEGLGLGPMEAMSVGKPVVATGWSGNVDFMDGDNSALVPFSMVPVRSAQGSPYHGHADQEWADPDVDAAAEALRSLAADPALRASIGERARAAIAAIAASDARADAIAEIARLADSGSVASPDHRSRVAAMRTAPYRAWGLVGRMRAVAAAALRGVGLRPPLGPPRLIPHDSGPGGKG